MQRCILVIDQGTSATKAVLVGEDGLIKARFDTLHKQYYPQPGWVEHDPIEIAERMLEAAAGVLKESGVDAGNIAAVAISNQRETALVWDRSTGIPIYPAIVWQCNRAEDICRRLEAANQAEWIKEKTGLVLSPYFSAAKIAWILENLPGAREKAQAGTLAAGNMDAWLIWNLTGGRVHATDYSNASRTQLFNIHTLSWDDTILEAFRIPVNMLPKVMDSDAVFGVTTLSGLLPNAVPITGVMGDSHAALFGQLCFQKGMAKATYGTGSSIMMNIGEKPVISQGGLVSSLAWSYSGKAEYVLEGNLNCTGAVIKWLVDDLELISSSKDAGEIAKTVTDTGGVYLVPAFVGLGAPYWDSHARASVTGMTRGTKKAHVVRAAEECIAYQVKDLVDLMRNESGLALIELRVDGGPTRDAFLMQFQADMLNMQVTVGHSEELSARGAALMAGLSIQFWNSKDDLRTLHFPATIYNSNMNDIIREPLYRGWKHAVASVLTKRF